MSDRRIDALIAFGALTPDEAQRVLRRMLDDRPELAELVLTLIAEQAEDVDIEGVADSVCEELQELRVEQVWDSSGATRDGYADPGDVAFGLIESTLQPFLEETLKLETLDRPYEADQYLAGIIMGLHEFEFDIKSDVKDYADGGPESLMIDILQQWRKRVKSSDRIEALSFFLEQNCTGWEAQLLRVLK